VDAEISTFGADKAPGLDVPANSWAASCKTWFEIELSRRTYFGLSSQRRAPTNEKNATLGFMGIKGMGGKRTGKSLRVMTTMEFQKWPSAAVQSSRRY